jgi:hypothetical protein
MKTSEINGSKSMKVGRWKIALTVTTAAVMLATMTARPLIAVADSSKGIMMYEDTRTGAFYSKPGKGRIAIGKLYLDGAAPPISPTVVQEQITKEVSKHDEELRTEFMQNQETLLQKNADLTRQVAEIKPAWTEYMESFKNKFRFGTLIYADWRMYSHTTYQPQELTQINNPGIGNNWYNSFDISRAYLNFFFFPTDDWTARVTPNIYRQFGTVTADSAGSNGTYPSSEDGNLTFRLKYAYLQYSKLFEKLGVDPMKSDTITVGQAPNPLVDWEEQMYGFRYVNLTPWNYLSLSSTQQGISVQGPIKFHDLQYIDYDAGVYNNASFHAAENTNTKQAMARVSVYPFGAKWKYDGLGFTGFYDYGYGNVTPDTNTGAPAPAPFFNGPKAHITRIAGLIHYNTDWWGLAFEYDQGHNAFGSGNLFSAVAPAGKYNNNNILAQALLNNGRAVEQGYDVFGHLHIPETPFTLFGMFEWFQPNTHVNLNPFDFQRWITGISYQYNEFLRFSLSTQNLLYYHDNFAFSQAEARKFAPVTFGAVAPPGAPGTVPNSVFRDDHSIFLNLEFNY